MPTAADLAQQSYRNITLTVSFHDTFAGLSLITLPALGEREDFACGTLSKERLQKVSDHESQMSLLI